MTAGAATPQAGAAEAREALVRRAVESANSNALRMALYQLTGDPDLAAMRLAQCPIRGGALVQTVVADEDLPALRAKAMAFLADPPASAPAAPDAARALELLRRFNDEPLTDNYVRAALEELAFDDFPRDVQWTRPPAPDTLAALHVLIIGAGISGIAAGVQLERLGIPYTVIERQPQIGGVWQINAYPDARVDTPSFTYQYRFEKNYPWTEVYPSRDETRRYLNLIADKYGVRPHIRTGCEVVTAAWDEARGLWVATVRDADGAERALEANFLISAAGLFAKPNHPDIPGMESFQGPMFHTSRWDPAVDLAGKRVAIIGTGSTGTQLTPAVARVAAAVTVYQRTANWIAGVDGLRAPVPPEMRFLFDTVPYYWNWFCYSGFNTAYQLQNAQSYDRDWEAAHGSVSRTNDQVRTALMGYLTDKLGSRPDLVAKCTPDHPPLARRLVVDNGFYDTLLEPHVELVTAGVTRITPTGVVSADGETREVDVIVLGAGFQVSEYLWPVDYRGVDGLTPQEAWKADGARAYLGLTMPGFPNFFMMYGPNGQPRSGGFYSWAECWARYAATLMVQVVERGARVLDLRRDVFEAYNARLDAAMAGIIWEGTKGYYNNRFGRCDINVPFRTDDYHAGLALPDLADYEVR